MLLDLNVVKETKDANCDENSGGIVERMKNSIEFFLKNKHNVNDFLHNAHDEHENYNEPAADASEKLR